MYHLVRASVRDLRYGFKRSSCFCAREGKFRLRNRRRFIARLIGPDANSAKAAQIVQTAKNTHLISTLTELEGINALQRRVFRKEVSHAQAKSSRSVTSGRI
jgi:hypothetical protein